MKTEAGPGAVTFRAGVFRRRVAWLFVAQAAVAVAACVAVALDRAWLAAAIEAVLAIGLLTWIAVRRQWSPVSALARRLGEWRDGQSDPAALHPGQLSRRTDAELVVVAHGLHGFAARIADFSRRERNFTRDASHELRTPLTVVRTSVDMLADEDGLSDFGRRSVRRIHRATRELEALVEVMLILAREAEPMAASEQFVVNDVLRRELEIARDLMAGASVELRLEEPARFALHGSARAFSVLCWQLIRHACQHAGAGKVVVTVSHSALTVRHEPSGAAAGFGGERSHFELTVAQRISERFAWPIELLPAAGRDGTVRVCFPNALPAAA